MFRWITGVAVSAALLALGVGCGGGDESTTEVTKAEFTKQANAICAEGHKEREAAAENFSKEVASKSNGQGGQAVQKAAEELVNETFVPSLENQLEQLKKVGVPTADEAKISKMMTTFSEEMAEVERGGVQALIRAGSLSNFEKEAEAYGLTCTVF